MYKDLTYKIIGCCFEVYNILGYGFLENVYHNALIEKLTLNNITTESEMPITVHYKDKNVGDYKADVVLDGKIILELKAEKTYNKNHEAQFCDYIINHHIFIGACDHQGQAGAVSKSVSAFRKNFQSFRSLVLTENFISTTSQ